MKNLLFAAMALVLFAFNGNAQEKEHIKISNETLERYKLISTNVAEEVKKVKEIPEFKSKPENFESELKKAISPLIDISKKVINESRINRENVRELNENLISDEQLITIGGLIIAQEVGINATSSVTECLTYAFFGFELSGQFWSSFTTRRQLLKAIGKAASKYIGVIGTALIVYDFTDCMGWI